MMGQCPIQYTGTWHGQSLGPKDLILSADEKTSIQARIRCHPALSPGQLARIENEYERGGALQYLAAWDVRRGYVMGRCEPTTGIEPFGRLVNQVLAEEPYRSAERLFWIVDNGSSHRGDTAKRRLHQVEARIILVHTRWLNQVEIYWRVDWGNCTPSLSQNGAGASRLTPLPSSKRSNHPALPMHE
jgi:hypothetical protein